MIGLKKFYLNLFILILIILGPTKRPVYNCFVGCSQCCDQIEDGDNFKYNKVCPKDCRPKEHQDWIYC